MLCLVDDKFIFNEKSSLANIAQEVGAAIMLPVKMFSNFIGREIKTFAEAAVISLLSFHWKKM